MKSNEIRQRFLDFFARHGHRIVSSGSLVPRNDPSLLFTGAGMNQFKEYFLSSKKDDLKRAVSCQKCFRTTDIESVGKTSRHLTFLEMLGNFSFGDYFKQEAINWAWQFMIEEMQLSPSKLWVTIYQNDEESYQLWSKEIGLPDERIIRLGEDSNFWNMGPTGPCGPCSEIIYDMGEKFSCGGDECKPGCDCARYLEIWNLVFTQYDRQPDGSLQQLPQKNIDTGMGLERISAVMQGLETVFETDLLKIIKEAIQQIIEAFPSRPNDYQQSLNIIADHLRALTFTLTDGVIPSNEGRGYVARKLLRRAMGQGKVLGIDGTFLHKLIPVVVKTMGETYPELVSASEKVILLTKGEEERFLSVLERLPEIEAELKELAQSGNGKRLPGEVYFRYYDTYGIPRDIIRETATNLNMEVDEEGFERALREQQERARVASGFSTEFSTDGHPAVRAVNNRPTIFLGYKQLEAEGEVLAIFNKHNPLDEANTGNKIEIVLDRTPFYGEAGGQVGDCGEGGNKNCRLLIDNTSKVNDVIIHHGKVEQGTLKVGMQINMKVDWQRRLDTARNHTATHLLQYALRKQLGQHVVQSGSFVGANYLRFDFTHPTAIKQAQLFQIETLVNEKIWENSEIHISYLSLDEAKAQGALALFGEKYGDTVRLISIADYSRELCGGTHLNATGQIGLFRIVAESSIAAGIRRIEAVTGRRAYQMMIEEREIINNIGQQLKISPSELVTRIESILSENRSLEKQISERRRSEILSKAEDILKQITTVNGVKVITYQAGNADHDMLRSLSDSLKKSVVSGIIVLGATSGGRVNLLATVTADLVEKGYHAGELIKQIAVIVGGGGGGRPDLAQAGGKNVKKLDEALALVPHLIKGH